MRPVAGASPAISLTITAANDKVLVGAPLDLKVLIHNISGHDIPLSGGYVRDTGDAGSLMFSVDVRMADGSVAPETAAGFADNGHHDMSHLSKDEEAKYNELRKEQNGKHAGIGPVSVTCGTLKRGETAETGTSVNRFYKLSEPGVYTIQISMQDGESGQIVKSNKITVTVVPKS